MLKVISFAISLVFVFALNGQKPDSDLKKCEIFTTKYEKKIGRRKYSITEKDKNVEIPTILGDSVMIEELKVGSLEIKKTYTGIATTLSVPKRVPVKNTFIVVTRKKKNGKLKRSTIDVMSPLYRIYKLDCN